MAKIFLITIVVSFVTIFLPVANDPSVLLDLNTQFHFLTRCLFIFAITIPFDIRDMDYDKEDELITIPRKYGIQGAKNISFAMLALMSIVAGLHYWLHIGLTYYGFLAIVGSALISIFAIAKLRPQSSEYYYSLVIEGMMIVQFGLVWAVV